ncbi:hypothetical protein RFI_12255 [Reticulomyxa filosa]|uniref:Serine aminopeptidase S33 domain-containing protein n=1 Tax=Reticulomyxa filosa TaxID=46433 RepID=X6NHU4_RETFI|nr:hypothetical protein RFI_12255 [Reticulomyxa filosa]|eukprot:ETO24902.1 hypothetical protein RFI_12255 [Reticulomyxa filosa]
MFPLQYDKNSTYTPHSFNDNLFYIPFEENRKDDVTEYVDKDNKLCAEKGSLMLFVPGCERNKPSHVILLFHGNGVDLGPTASAYNELVRSLAVHLCIVEYPGYGILKGSCNVQQAIKHSENVYNFLVKDLKIPPSQLIIMGQSIGTGVACHLAHRKHNMLILISPFTSITALAQERYTITFGKQWFGKILTDLDGTAKNEAKDISLETMSEEERKKGDGDKCAANEMTDTSALPLSSSEKKSDKKWYSSRRVFSISQAQSAEKNVSLDRDVSDIPLTEHQVNYTIANDNDWKQEKLDIFNNLAQVEKMKSQKILLFHGTEDEVIPFQHSVDLEQAIKEVKRNRASGSADGSK